MRKYLLAGVATLGAAGFAGAAFAQAPAAAPPSPTEGTLVTAPSGGPAYVNNNNNYQAALLPGPVANPTPGTIVIHVNGKVQVDFLGTWTNADTRVFPGVGVAKVMPQDMESFARIYLGADAMATNGLRYGAAMEVRENFSGQPSGISASVYSFLETMYVRRAFTYVGGSNWGIVRAGQADGVIGIFDNGVTTFQFLPTGNLNGGDLEFQNVFTNSNPPFFFLGQAGAEYANTKFVYLSPQIAGFDFGFQYAPNTSNGFGIGANGGGIDAAYPGIGVGTGLTCTTATTGCPTLSAGPGPLDGSRIINQTVVGVRYQGVLAGVGVLAYAAWENSGTADYTGAQVGAIGSATGPGSTGAGSVALGLNSAALAGSRYNGHYDGLSFGSGGLALTYAGFTVGGNIIGGRLNNQLQPTPKNAVGEIAYLVGAKYVTGPLTIGIVAEHADYQGVVQMTGITQRRARAIDLGASYAVAPGYQVYAEYIWQDTYQGGVNQLTGALGSNANNEARSQGFLIGNVVNF